MERDPVGPSRTWIGWLLLVCGVALGAAGCVAEDAPGADGIAAADAGAAAPDLVAPDARRVTAFATEVGPPAAAPAGGDVPLRFALSGPDGAPAADLPVVVTVGRGGGRVSPAEARTDDEGRVSFTWTLGPAPVWNGVSVRVLDPEGSGADDVVWTGPDLSVRATLAEPIEPAPFADVDGWLAAQGETGSTEDLAFGPDGALVIGVPGGLARVTPAGEVEGMVLTGDAIEHPLGVAFDAAGAIWVADTRGKALKRVTPDSGAIETVLAEVDGAPLGAPNYVAIGPDGAVYLSDPCLGAILRLDPASGAVTARLDLDRTADGGPNGLAFAADGRLWFLTENTFLLCGHADVAADARLGHLSVVDVADDGFGAPYRVAEALGHFGDGLAFDAEGNLYAIVDVLEGVSLEESLVLVLAPDESEPVPFLRTTDRLLANLAFGSEPFGTGTLYISLLSVPPVTAVEMRGLMRAEVGIPGAL